jgi:hypothetical protein
MILYYLDKKSANKDFTDGHSGEISSVDARGKTATTGKDAFLFPGHLTFAAMKI